MADRFPGFPTFCLLFLLVLTGCASGSQAAAPTPSTTPTATIRVSGSGTALPIVQRLAEDYAKQHPEVRFVFDAGTNSGGGIKGVLGGTLDLAVANRPLSEAEAREAIVYQPFARDAVVFAVRVPEPILGLTSAQVRDIYGGALTDWQQLGGAAGPIVALDRDADESMRKLVLLALMGDRPVAARATTLTTAREMLLALESTPGCLGYTSLGLLRLQRPQGVRALTLDGVVADHETLASGRYPWSMTFGLVQRRESPPAAQAFAAWVLGPEGRRILEAYAYAPATP